MASSRIGRIVCTVAASLAMAALVAGTPADDENSAQAVIEHMLDALGGEKAIAGLKSLSVSADCTGPGGDFHTEVASLRPGWVWFRQTNGERVTEVWSGPERTWHIDAEGEVKDHGPGVRSFVRAHEFHLSVLEMTERFTDHRVGEAATINEQACIAVLMKDDQGKEATLYLNDQTHLPVMLETNPEGAAGAVRVYYEKWEPKAGVLLFHAFELTEGSDRTFRYDYQSIEPNVVSAERFAEPK